MTKAEIKEKIEQYHNNDLKIVDDLIIKYNKDYSTIIKDDHRPNNDTGRLHIDFFNRCKNIKKDIEELINNSSYKEDSINTLYDYQQAWKNNGILDSNLFAFACTYNRYGEINKLYLDSDFLLKEKPVNHLKHIIPDSEKLKYEKKNFVKSNYPLLENLLQDITPNRVFDDWISLLKDHPLLLDYVHIFEDLKQNWEYELYYTFYIAGTFQIEGFFNKIIDSIPKKLGVNPSSLQDKVRKLRQLLIDREQMYYANSLDYFAYILPINRHILGHTGHPNISADDTIKRMSIQLLLDLRFLYFFIKNFDSPFLRLYSIIEDNEKEYFFKLDNFIEFIDLHQNNHSKRYVKDLEKFKKLVEDSSEEILKKLHSEVEGNLDEHLKQLKQGMWISALLTKGTDIIKDPHNNIITLLTRENLGHLWLPNYRENWTYVLNVYKLRAYRGKIKNDVFLGTGVLFGNLFDDLFLKHKELFFHIETNKLYEDV